MVESAGVSATNSGALEMTLAASKSLAQSWSSMLPRRRFTRSTRPWQHKRRIMIWSMLISSEKMAVGVGVSPLVAALSARFSANAVLPMLGRAATMTRSESWSPAVSSSSFS